MHGPVTVITYAMTIDIDLGIYLWLRPGFDLLDPHRDDINISEKDAH